MIAVEWEEPMVVKIQNGITISTGIGALRAKLHPSVTIQLNLAILPSLRSKA